MKQDIEFPLKLTEISWKFSHSETILDSQKSVTKGVSNLYHHGSVKYVKYLKLRKFNCHVFSMGVKDLILASFQYMLKITKTAGKIVVVY